MTDFHAPEPATDDIAADLARAAEVGRPKIMDRSRFSTLGSIGQDFRFALRTLGRRKGLTVSVVGILGIGIGATGLALTVVYAVLLRPLPYHQADRIVAVWEHNHGLESLGAPLTGGNFARIRAGNRSFASIAAINVARRVTLATGGVPVQLSAAAVSDGFFETLGVEPLLGRGIGPEDDTAEAMNVVVLGHRLWRQQFGGAEDILGRDVLLDGEPYRVIGVMPEGFAFPRADEFPSSFASWRSRSPDLWIPLALGPDALANRSVRYLIAVGRLTTDVTLPQAAGDLHRLADAIAGEFPGDTPEGFDLVVVPLQEQVVREARPGILAFAGAATLLLALVCINVVSLLLTHFEDRQQEVSVRRALGASRFRVVRHLVSEGALLGASGGAAGLLLAVLAIDALPVVLPQELPRQSEIAIDPALVAIGVIVTLLTTVLCGVLPALVGSRARAFRGEVTLATSARSLLAGGIQAALVVTEIALAFALLVVSALLVHSFVSLWAVDTGFEEDNVLSLNLTLPDARYAPGVSQTNLYQDLYERIRSLPGVRDAGAVSAAPLTGHRVSGPFGDDDRPALDHEDAPMASYHVVSVGALDILGIPLIQGRAIVPTDDSRAIPVAQVNRELAETFWPGEDPIGKRLHLWSDVEFLAEAPVREVVGVVGNVRQAGLYEPVWPQIYLPQKQVPWPWYMSVVVKASADPTSLVAAIREELHSIDPSLAFADVTTLDAVRAETLARPRFLSLTTSVFSGVGLFVALLGTYAFVALSVGRRKRELGIRIALGATPKSLRRLILGQAAGLTAIGLLIGSALALALGHLLSSLLFSISPWDWSSWVVVAMLLAAVTLLAAWSPTRRVSRLDPVDVLRRH